MYSLTVILSIYSVCCCMVNAQQNVCTTTSGVRGECIPINDCQPFVRVLSNQNRSQYEVDNLRKSHCGFDGNTPKVCCPELNELTPTAKPTCVTPEGNPGECISLLSCQALSNLMKPPVSTETIQYLQKLKCNGPEQHSVCCATATTLPPVRSSCASTVSAYPPDPLTKCCGNDDRVDNKVYGGGPTAVDQYPWLTLIEYKKEKVVKTRCGGALISGKYVLTAGHCVIGKILESGKPTNVRLGEYNTTNEGPDCTKVEANGTDCTEGAIRILIERTIPHPEYNPLNSQKKNDIALIRMIEMAPYTYFIRPICLPTLDVTLRSTPFNLTVAGWGAVSTRESSSSIKLHVTLPFVNQGQCQPAYKIPSRNVALWKGQLCAGGEQGKDSCNGDSGGPLMYKNGKIYEAIGLVSFGPQNCGTENVPGIYTNVYEYKSWIMSNITP